MTDELEDKRLVALEAMRDWMEAAPPNEFFGNIAQVTNEYKLQLSNLNNKPKISRELGYTAFSIQIDNGCKPIESLTQAAIEHNEDVDQVLSMKSDKWRWCPVMVGFHSDFFNDKTMAVSTSELKQAVKTSTTLNSGLTRVYRFQQHEKAIRELKQKALEQEKEIERLKLEQINTTLDVEWLKEVSGWKMTLKEKAKALRTKNVPFKEISELLDKNERTIRRWCESLEGSE